MSYDFYIDKICSHIVVDEVAVLDTETGSSFLIERRPSTTRATVRIDGVVVPEGGLYSDVNLSFVKSEPYRVVYNKNDLIIFKFGSQQIVIQIPAGLISAKNLASYLSQKVPELIVTSKDGRVNFKSSSKNVTFGFPDPRWTDKSQSLVSTSRILGAYKLFGIVPGRVVSTRKVFPGYKVMMNPNAFVEEWIVKFDSPIFNSSPVITISYQTIAAFCGRCGGTKVEHDYSIANGTYSTVRNTDLLVQEFTKFLFTIKGSHWKWPWLGSGILNRIGSKANTASGLASSFISLDINNAFSVYQNIKSQQDSRFPGQNVTDSEYPFLLSNFKVESMDDPTSYYATFSIVNRSRELIPITKSLSLPDPYQLTSSSSGMMANAGRGFQLVT